MITNVTMEKKRERFAGPIYTSLSVNVFYIGVSKPYISVSVLDSLLMSRCQVRGTRHFVAHLRDLQHTASLTQREQTNQIVKCWSPFVFKG
jgi:hypothetical protein